MSDRVVIGVTEETYQWLGKIRNAQDGNDRRPCFVDMDVPCGFCGEPTQYVNGTGDAYICDDCREVEENRQPGEGYIDPRFPPMNEGEDDDA